MNETTVGYGEFELFAATAGEGEPLVLVPGITMSIDRWAEAGYVDALATDRQVIAVDPLGHGRSSKTADVDAYHPDELIAHLRAVLDHLGVERADVWGYSRGAAMVNQFARAETSRVRSMIYAGNVLFDPQPLLEQIGMAPDIDERRAAHERALAGDWSAYWDFFPLPLADDLKADIESRNDIASISAATMASLLHGRPWSGEPPVPTLAYWGTGEIFHQMNSEHAADLDIEVGTVEGGHAEAFDPAAAAIDLVQRFLASRP